MTNLSSSCGCGCSGERLVFACSGAADVGEIADRAARQTAKQGVAKMFCLAGVGGQVADIAARTKAAGKIVVIDGCDKDCGKQCMQNAGVSAFVHLRLTDLGMEKGKSPATAQCIDAVAQKVSVAFTC